LKCSQKLNELYWEHILQTNLGYHFAGCFWYLKEQFSLEAMMTIPLTQIYRAYSAEGLIDSFKFTALSSLYLA
jgi:hypothetical protein